MYENRIHNANPLLFHSEQVLLPLITQQSNHHEVDAVGPPVSPLDFPTPSIGHTNYWTNVPVYDNVTGRRFNAKTIMVPCASSLHQRPQFRRSDGGSHCNMGNHGLSCHPNHAYLTKKRISKSTSGQVRLCLLLRPRNSPSTVVTESDDDNDQTKNEDGFKTELEWETSDELVVIKSLLKDSVGSRKSSVFAQQPLREVAAQQYVGNYHPHILGCHEAFQDDEYIHTVIPYCPGRDLYTTLVGCGGGGDTVPAAPNAAASTKTTSGSLSRRLSESDARRWFGQLLEGVAHLQNKGVCHGGICLENILTDIDGNLVLADFGLALRIPYVDESNMGGGGISDVSNGSSRRLIRCLVPCDLNADNGGNPMYMAPELVEASQVFGACSSKATKMEECCFDGFAVDLWSLGVVLFVWLTGSAPFHIAHESDARFAQISVQGLLHKIPSLQELSPSAVHLLQNMLWADPLSRLTLSDILVHPWVNPPETVHGKAFEAPLVVGTADNPRPSKKRLHHLSFYQFLSFHSSSSDAVLRNSGKGCEKPLLLSQRMASF